MIDLYAIIVLSNGEDIVRKPDLAMGLLNVTQVAEPSGVRDLIGSLSMSKCFISINNYYYKLSGSKRG